MVLTVQVSKLEKSLNAKAGAGKSANTGSRKNTIDPKCTTKEGDSIVIDSVVIWWYSHYHYSKKFPDRSHMPYEQEDYDQWKANKENKKKKSKPNKPTKLSQPTQKLKLKDTMNSVLITSYAF